MRSDRIPPADDPEHRSIRPAGRRCRWVGLTSAVLFTAALGALLPGASEVDSRDSWAANAPRASVAAVRPLLVSTSLEALPCAVSTADLEVDEERPVEADAWLTWADAALGSERLWVADARHAPAGYDDRLRCRGPPVA